MRVITGKIFCRPVDNGEIENCKWGAGRRHYPVLTNILSFSHDDHPAAADVDDYQLDEDEKGRYLFH